MTKYEWDIEEVDTSDEHLDIIDHNHADALWDYSEAETARINGAEFCLVLVKDYRRECDQYEERTWAYVVDKELPETFRNGEAVPKKLRAEFDRFKSVLK